jgi:type I restriction enzyme M protein
MLDQSTKRKIDNARDILVGKVPDPKSQVEQITIALIYKFMDDMDKEAEEWGGKPTFFTDEYKKYAWSNIFDPRLGGFDLIALYGDAIVKMNQNPNIPQLFRDIFKNAYLPYRDPETLKSFLKEINEFTYDHSEQLGDAFEYLLSVMDSQGDAGQFRTPRHIIDFIVEIVAPKKNETVLDPACGTAGFLISSYKHILKSNTKDRNGDKLTPDERKRLLNNFMGYDISPDMVRLSLVNLYLHGFSDPKIVEYDTLTSEEKWNETADVILANPPFMTPKGGIRPHKRFSIQAKRSEVLFVDYIAEHLNPQGRAGVIVPEGIIFQSQTAYKNLRKMLVEDYLWAVVSLPAGVFNPYSGVKTSILLMDKTLVKKSDKILFVKIDSDGFNLGAQRRPIDKNDLPQALELIKDYKNAIMEGREVKETGFAHAVEKTRIAESGDWNLSGEQYRMKDELQLSSYDIVKLNDICNLIGGGTPLRKRDEYWTNGNIKWISAKHINGEGRIVGNELITEKALAESSAKIVPRNSTVVVSRVSVGKIAYADDDYAVNQDLTGLSIKNSENLNDTFLFLMMRKLSGTLAKNAQGLGVKGITRKYLANLKVPLPPLNVQKAIVAEIDGYQKIIDGARQVVDNYKPTIKIDPDWENAEIDDICDLVRGSSPRPKGDKRYYGGKIPRLMVSDITRDGMYTQPTTDSLTEEGAKLSRPMKKGDVIMAVSGNPGLPTILKTDACIHDGFVGYRNLNDRLLPEFFYFVLLHMKEANDSQSIGAVFRNLNTSQIRRFKISTPPIPVQQEIVSQIEAEQEIVNANKKLIEMFEQKIKDNISEVWGE